MKNSKRFMKRKEAIVALALPLALGAVPMQAASPLAKVQQTSVSAQAQGVKSARKINATTVEVVWANNQKTLFDFYGDNIFRIFRDPQGGQMRDPQATPAAQILVNNPRKPLSTLNVNDESGKITIVTDKAHIDIDKTTGLMKIVDCRTNNVVIEETKPVTFGDKDVTLTLKANDGEYFYGGGVQNGRFSHRGKVIAIENQNSWTDSGVASPNPFYWSTGGYGFMWYTFNQGKYDFGAEKTNQVNLSHEGNYLDVFFMLDQTPVSLLNDFYQLTGNPVLLPKFGFYEGHLNAYNRDFWKEDKNGVAFEDGKNYVESQKDNGGTKESLNGEKNNYQFSARAVVDRYKAHDMPLGWVLPNDGYGAGYGQTSTLDGNIQNLKDFGDYARKNGVEIGLWTQSDLHPKEGVEPLLQRDIIKEVRDAGVRVLKTDVAWVGAGYSFGLNGVSDVGTIMPEYGNGARPFIISLDGWAGTQRYAGIWSGDQTGGVWEYIRFHIPTYIGSGLSGQPNITSDMDGIFGGKNVPVNVRDFEWKTFTPMQLNMDGWGSNPKYPHILGEPAASINRTYLKLKSQLIPYTYSIAKEAVNGKPIIRAMFLDYPNDYTHGTATQYQYMYGPSFLVAPIYQATKSDKDGNDLRNGIYLPEGQWIDYFSGESFAGNRILNNFDAPLWKLPVFVKAGAIIPMTNPNNNVHQIDKSRRIYEVYPAGNTQFTEYDDDGTTQKYMKGEGASTAIEASAVKNVATVTIHPTKGSFDGFVKEKTTEVRVNVTAKPKTIVATVGGKKVKLAEAKTVEDFAKGTNVYFYNATPNLNQFATAGSEFEKVAMVKNPMVCVKLAATDVTANEVVVTVKGYQFAPADKALVSTGALTAPKAQLTDHNVGPYTLKPTWEKAANADYYEIEFNGMNYSTIKDTCLLFEGLKAETNYTMQVRAVNKDGVSPWTSLSAKTKANPLEFAIQGITAETSCDNQGGQGTDKLFDFDESDIWHTKWGAKATPFDLTIDLNTINVLDKLQYLPRVGNGAFLKGTLYYSMDKATWTKVTDIDWQNDGKTKTITFDNKPTARYLKFSIANGVGDFGSGREMYIFKVPGTESYRPGDINHDRLIDMNDFTSYMNYTGLRKGDSDFEGYVSKGDLNINGLIDAYDISVVATKLRGGAGDEKVATVDGTISLSASKSQYNAGENIVLTVKGTNLRSVNALSFALPYNAEDMEFVSITPKNMKDMENITNDRLHKNGVKALYPTFVNIGAKAPVEGTADLFTITFKAKKKVKVNFKAIDGFLVDKNLNTKKF